MITESGVVHNEGADIAYDREGAGPLLLLIVGGNGDSRRYTALSALMANDYTVVRYDRRANFRSTGNTAADLDMAQQARDAAALIRHFGDEPAYVFGNSAGANIAIKLTEDHPERVRGLIAHEPPITNILPKPEAETDAAFFRDIYATYLAEGTAPAMKKFASAFVGLEQPPGTASTADAPPDQGGNMDRFLAHEFRNISGYTPDLERIRESRAAVITAVGRASQDALYVRTARAMAEALGCPCVDMTGNHVAFATEPDVFARELNAILRQFDD